MDESAFQSCEGSTAQGTPEDDIHELTEPNVALREVSPTIVALGKRLEQIRSAEIERYRSKLGTLEPSQLRAVDALTRGILSKMLRGSVRELKAHSSAPEHHVRLQLVRRIFGLA